MPERHQRFARKYLLLPAGDKRYSRRGPTEVDWQMTLAREQRPADSERSKRNAARSATPPIPAEQRQRAMDACGDADARANLASLQRLAGNRAVAALIATGPTPVLRLASRTVRR